MGLPSTGPNLRGRRSLSAGFFASATAAIATEGAKELETGEVAHGRTGLVTCEFGQIDTPGLYVENRTGTLLRIPEDAIAPGRSPVIQIVATYRWVVTRISEDPYLSLTKARMIAANLDLDVNF